MLGIRSDKDKESTNAIENGTVEIKKAKISLCAELHIGKPSKLTLINSSKEVTVIGDVVEKAINSPMSQADVEKNLLKFGQTPFEVENVTVNMDDGIIIRNSSINALRRKGVEAFFETQRKAADCNLRQAKANTPGVKIKTALFNGEEQVPANSEYFDVIFVPLDRYYGSAAVNGVCMPPVVLDKEWDEVEKMLSFAKEKGIKYALVSNIGQVKRLKKFGFELIGDYRFNAFNSYTVEYLNSLGISRVIMSPELTLAQLRDFHGQGVIAYGKLPLMTTHKCVLKDTYGCEKCKGYIKDRQGASLFAEGIYGHRNIIYNSVPIYMADKQSEIKPYSCHFIFSDEKRDESYEIIEAYKKGLPTSKGMKRIK